MIENNLNFLRERLPHLINYKLSTQTQLEIIEAKTGRLTAIYKGTYLHSKYDPIKESQKIAEETINGNLIVVAGFGLGYLLTEIVKKYPNTTTVLFEPDINIFMEALKVIDITELNNAKNLIFLVGESSEVLKGLLIPRLVKKITYIPLPNRVKHDEELFNPIKEIIRLYHDRLRINKNTLLKFGKLWVKNQSKNLPLMGYKSDISTIFGKFKDIPAIIISAGPSMELIMPHIKELREKFVLLAVDTALKSLLEEGIEPDFVMSIDSQYWNARHLEGITTNKCILIADSSIQPSALRAFKDRVYFTKSTFPIGEYFERVRDPFPLIASGGSVSTNMWDFTQKLGVSELYFIGQDLGYPGNITHYKNSYFEKNMLTSSTKINNLESQSFKYIYDGYPTIVKSNNGDSILSDKRMSIYIDWFKEKLSLFQIKNSYNLSPNGCKLDGMEYKPISSIINYKNKREEINNIIKTLKKRDSDFFLPEILKAALVFKENLELIVDLGSKAENLCIDIEAKYKKGLDINNLLKELTIIDNKIVNYNHSQTLSFIIEPFINQITESETGTALEGLKLSHNLYNKIVNTGILHIKYINQSINNIKKIINN